MQIDICTIAAPSEQLKVCARSEGEGSGGNGAGHGESECAIIVTEVEGGDFLLAPDAGNGLALFFGILLHEETADNAFWTLGKTLFRCGDLLF